MHHILSASSPLLHSPAAGTEQSPCGRSRLGCLAPGQLLSPRHLYMHATKQCSNGQGAQPTAGVHNNVGRCRHCEGEPNGTSSVTMPAPTWCRHSMHTCSKQKTRVTRGNRCTQHNDRGSAKAALSQSRAARSSIIVFKTVPSWHQLCGGQQLNHCFQNNAKLASCVCTYMGALLT